jgi:ATP-dependent DNA helicase RecG
MSTTTIFISSAQKELAEERRAVKAFVEGDPLLRRFFRVFLFEDLPAADRRADDVYLGEVDRCGVYVGLFGNDYGFEDVQGVSPTEREFDRATEKRKQRLIFVKGADDGARHPKMAALVRKAAGQLLRRRFGSTPELRGCESFRFLTPSRQYKDLRWLPCSGMPL